MATNKRVRNKQAKIAENKKLNSGGYSAKEIKNLSYEERTKEIRRIKRNEQRNARRSRNVEKWESLGIDKSIISKLGLRDKNPDLRSQSEIKSLKYKQRAIKAAQTRKANYIRQNRVYHASEYLAISFALSHGGELQNTAQYKHLTFNQILARIKMVRQEASTDPTGSGTLNAFFQFFTGDAESCQEEQEAYSERGYNLQIGKMIREEYQPILNRNDWTMREMAELTLCIIEQCKNSDVEHSIEALEYYCHRAGLPFDEIFDKTRP